MSRIGKNPVPLPSGVEASMAGRTLSVKGKVGQLSWDVPSDITVSVENNAITFTPASGSQQSQAMWGTGRALAANMVKGVSEGFEKKLSIVGVGYRASVAGRTLNLSVGHSHPVAMTIPEGLDVTVTENTQLSVKGVDKQRVGQFASEIRRMRPPEPYKGKGIRYADEYVVMKEGKKK